MVRSFRFLLLRKGTLAVYALSLLGVYAIHNADGDSYGITGRSKSGCGEGCHGGGLGITVVTVSTAARKIIAGQTYTFQLSVSNQSEAGAGCDISVDDTAILSLDSTNSGLWIPYLTTELTHTAPLTFTGDSAVWTFKYTAPAQAGTAHIFAAGNAVNMDGGDGGDIWNVTTYTVNVLPAVGPQISAPVRLSDTALRGDTVQLNFWVKDTGTSELNIFRYGMKFGISYFIPDNSQLSVDVGDSSEVTVDFIPSATGTIVDTLHIYSNDTLMPVASIALVGLGTSGNFHLSANPTNFGQVALTHSDTMTVTISNNGTGLLSVTPENLTVSNTDFTVISVKPAIPPYNIAPKGTVVVTVAFAPSKIGSDTATFPLIVSEYEGNTIDTSIVLIGTGIPNASVDPEITNSVALAISPNPSSGIFNISSTGMTEAADVDVFDPAGRIVAQVEISLGSESSLYLSGLPNGTYFLSVRPQNGQPFMRRIVIER